MAKIKIKLYGNLRHYTSDKEKIHYIDIKESEKIPIAEIMQEIGIPQNEINIIFKNSNKVDIDEVAKKEDVIEILPVVGGG